MGDRSMRSVDPSRVISAYDAIAPVYAEFSERYRTYLDAVDRLVIDRLRPGMRLLDVGSGDGRRLKKIRDHHDLRDVVAVEPSREMAERCRETTGIVAHPLSAEALDALDERPFDAITALWNVLGHVADPAARLRTLTHLAKISKPEGVILLDVNNRHNRLAYGRWTVLGRRLIDAVRFDDRRGDAHYVWKIGGRSIPAFGHLFTPGEVERLVGRSGLRVSERWAVHYATGALSASPFDGQLFYVLRRADRG